MSDIFTENVWQTKRSCSQKVFLSNRKIRNLLVLGSQRHFVQFLQKLFAVFYSLKYFAQISIFAGIFPQEINFLQIQNFTVGNL